MKIYILKVNKKYQPTSSKIRYPRHSTYEGVEVQFFRWIQEQKDIITENPEEADFHYLPVFWTNYYLNHNFAKTGREELQEECSAALISPEKTFTLIQYDDGPLVDIGDTVVYHASRGVDCGWLDLPLLCAPHELKSRKKRWIASFVGREITHPIRKDLHVSMKHVKNMIFINSRFGEKLFVNVISKSYVCLSPRGYGGSSFRFFEAMQLGTVPVHIGNTDIRPFKKLIDWNSCSKYFEKPEEAINWAIQADRNELLDMGIKAQKIWYDIFGSDKWCEYLINELEIDEQRKRNNE